MILLTTMLLLAAQAVSLPASDRFDLANDAYRHGDYAAAITGYQMVLEQTGPNAEALYNLGNAYHKSGQTARAIASYEHALRLAPNLEQARHNLASAVRATERRLPRPRQRAWADTVFFWHSRLAFGTIANLALAAWILFWAVMTLRQWRPLPYTRAAASVLLLAAAALTASAWLRANPPGLAVALADRVPVRYGVSESDAVRFELYPGDRVAVDDARDGWVRVATADGERGWARAEHVLVVGDLDGVWHAGNGVLP